MSGISPPAPGRWVWAAFGGAGLAALFAAMGIYGAFKGAETQLASAKRDLEVIKPRLDASMEQALTIRHQIAVINAETSSLRAGMQYVGHIQMRQGFIASQAAQAGGDFVLLAGDSITEQLYLPSLAGLPTINGGMGGASMADVLRLLEIFPHNAPVKLVILEAGVNDAIASCACPGFAEIWEATLRLVVNKALDISPGAVAISTIFPLEPGKPASPLYNPDKILAYNKAIRTVAAEKKLILIDNDPVFLPLAKGGGRYTSDGVHLNVHGYNLWRENIQAALAKANFRPITQP